MEIIMGEQNNKMENKPTARTADRTDFKVPRSIASDIVCGLLALLTTLLVWLGGAA